MSHQAKVGKKRCLLYSHSPFCGLDIKDSEAWRKVDHRMREAWVSESPHREKLAPGKEPWSWAAPWARHQLCCVQSLKSTGLSVPAARLSGFCKKTESIECVYPTIQLCSERFILKELAHIITIDGKCKICWVASRLRQRLQFKSKGCLLRDSSCLGEGQIFVLFRSSRLVYITDGNLLYTESTNLNVNLIQKCPCRNIQTNV